MNSRDTFNTFNIDSLRAGINDTLVCIEGERDDFGYVRNIVIGLVRKGSAANEGKFLAFDANNVRIGYVYASKEEAEAAVRQSAN